LPSPSLISATFSNSVRLFPTTIRETEMKKVTATVAAIATVLSLAPAFAQDTINKGNPSMIPDRGAGAWGAGSPATGPRENTGTVDGTAGRSAAPGPTVGTAGQQPLPPNPGNR
jgi:hypothetical protein